MEVLGCPEVHEYAITSTERAKARDARVREFERQFTDWVEIAQVCLDVERDQDWKILGFHSWNAWLMDAAPRSRSYIYLAKGRLEELAPDIPAEELAQIPLGSAGILKQLSSKIRHDPKVIESAKKKPSEFRKDLAKNLPMQHFEPIVEQRLRFTLSQWERIDAAYQAYRLVDESASLETFFEFCVSECQ